MAILAAFACRVAERHRQVPDVTLFDEGPRQLAQLSRGPCPFDPQDSVTVIERCAASHGLFDGEAVVDVDRERRRARQVALEDYVRGEGPSPFGGRR